MASIAMGFAALYPSYAYSAGPLKYIEYDPNSCALKYIEYDPNSCGLSVALTPLSLLRDGHSPLPARAF
jgi:hypothetical protein